jgi:hypothetical protein
MRRLRLGAPSVTDRNPHLDANTVAEYLDNTLPSEGVADFEKVCLDSDVHLAEVASCHQILTLVLGEPAEINAASRQRMYELKDVPQTVGPPPPPTAGSAQAPAPGVPPTLDLGQTDDAYADRKPRPKPTVPEYLREPRKRGPWVAVAGVVLAVGVIGLLLMAFGQFEPETPVGNLLVQLGVIEARKAQEVAVAPETARAKPDEGNEDQASTGKAEPAGETKSETTQETKAAATPPTPVVVQPAKEEAKEPVIEQAKDAGKEPGATTAKAQAGEAAKEPVKDVVTAPQETPVGPTADLVIKSPTESGAAGTPETVKKPDVGTPAAIADGAASKSESKTAAESGDAAKAAPGTDATAKAPALAELLARFMSSDQVLLVDDAKGGWTRATEKQMLMPQRLLALPTSRAKVTLTIGVTLEILGGSQVELLASTPRELPGIRIFYGRVILMPLAQPGSRLRVAFGDRTGVVTFPDSDSVAAIEVRRIRVPGTNPEEGPPQIIASLFASTGAVEWNEVGGGEPAKTMRVTAPEWVSFNGALTSEPTASKGQPSWIVAAPISALDRRASALVAQPQALPTDRLARLALLELATSRPQREVRWLALRCLAYIGQFHDMVAALNDSARKLEWPEYIDQLREAVARDAESAAAVRQALEKQYPEQSARIYRMLWGYTDKDLQAGADRELVKALDDDMLAIRVLGYQNLKDLTGMGASYRPEQTAAKRQQPIRRWQERLDAGEIRVRTPEERTGAAAQDDVAPLPPGK